jgi:hypothetical protein
MILGINNPYIKRDEITNWQKSVCVHPIMQEMVPLHPFLTNMETSKEVDGKGIPLDISKGIMFGCKLNNLIGVQKPTDAKMRQDLLTVTEF